MRVGKKRFGAGVLAALATTLVLLLAPAAASAAEPDPAAWMYEPDNIVAIDLTLPQASLEALEAVPPTSVYQEATFSLAETDGTPGGIGTYGPALTVGIRIKGKAGSFRPLPQKSAFKIKFNSFVSGQKFLGLKKMTLNNMVQDPSMIHETLSYEAFRAMDVRGSRTGYAFVRLNGEPLGVYLNIEDLDDVGLEKRFGAFDDPQHIYEGEYGVDVRAAEVEDFEVDEGDDEDLSDLEAFAAAVEGSDPADWSERIEPHADLDQMTRMWAVENYVGHWDGYAGAPDDPGHDLPNNYYLFSDAAGRFQMLPWGADQTWEYSDAGLFDDGGGLLFEGCLADLSCEALYVQALRDLQGELPGLALDTRAAALAALLEPWQVLEPEPPREHSAAEIEEAVEDTRFFIAQRPGELAAWLPEPPEPPDPPEEPRPPDPTPPVEDDPPSPPPGAPSAGTSVLPPAAMTLAGPPVRGVGALRTRLMLHAVGVLTQRGTIATAEGPLTVCSRSLEVERPMTTTVRCRLSAEARKRLALRRLKVTLVTRFRAADGRVEETTRTLIVPRS